MYLQKEPTLTDPTVLQKRGSLDQDLPNLAYRKPSGARGGGPGIRVECLQKVNHNRGSTSSIRSVLSTGHVPLHLCIVSGVQFRS